MQARSLHCALILAALAVPAVAQPVAPLYQAALDAGASPERATALARAADLTEDVLLRASNAEAGDQFGNSVSVSGDRAVVGAIAENGPTNTTDGSGAAYVYEFDGTAWTETAVLRASNAGAFDNFGFSVSVSGGRVVVGAYREDGPVSATPLSGAAYVFDLVGGTWTETAILRPSNAEAGDYFGFSVSVSGGRVVVGAIAEDGPTDVANNTGAAYVFDLVGGAWTETALLRPSSAEAGDIFGFSVAVSGDRAVVGTTGEDGPTNATNNAGAAYVFDRVGGAWTEATVLRASNAEAGDIFGQSVSVSGDRVVVGAYLEDGPTNATASSGAAYVFDRVSGAWSETAVLRASNAEAGDVFGFSVSVSGDRAVVGAHFEDGPTNAIASSGAAYVFDRVGGAWTETVVLRASNAEVSDQFGWSVSVSGDRVAVGAIAEDGPTNAVNNAGAVYAFDLAEATTASEGSAGAPSLSAPFPNPVAQRTSLVLSLGEPEHVRASVVNALGREVLVVLDGKASGSVRLNVDTSRLAPGTYLIRVMGTSFTETRRITVVR